MSVASLLQPSKELLSKLKARIKVFNRNNTYRDVEREIALSRKAFILGVPTAISFGIVSVGKIRRHIDAIVATVTHQISNARVEAANNKIKLTIRMAYGFRSIDNLVALIYLRCGGRVVYLPGRAPVKVT